MLFCRRKRESTLTSWAEWISSGDKTKCFSKKMRIWNDFFRFFYVKIIENKFFETVLGNGRGLWFILLLLKGTDWWERKCWWMNIYPLWRNTRYIFTISKSVILNTIIISLSFFSHHANSSRILLSPHLSNWPKIFVDFCRYLLWFSKICK